MRRNKRPDGSLAGDNFDGLGFVRSASAALGSLTGARALVVGAGGVGSAIVAAVARIDVTDVDTASADRLVARVKRSYPGVDARVGAPDPTGCDIAVNATPLGMGPSDPLPFSLPPTPPTRMPFSHHPPPPYPEHRNHSNPLLPLVRALMSPSPLSGKCSLRSST